MVGSGRMMAAHVLIEHSTPQAFLNRATDWLQQDEPRHSVVLSVAHALTGSGHPFEPPYYLATVEQSGRVVGGALHPPPDGITLTDMPVAAAMEIATALAGVEVKLPDVSGPEAQVLAFAERWAQARGCEYRLECRYRWYAATQVLAPGRRPNGQLRLATPQDRDWVADWAAAYAAEVWSSAVDVPAFFDRRVSSRSLYVWEDGEPRAVAAVSGHTPNTARVSAVYAPERHRGGGYASQLVAEVTRAILSERRWSVLSADVQNISVNGLYARIGYRPVCETAAVAFDC